MDHSWLSFKHLNVSVPSREGEMVINLHLISKIYTSVCVFQKLFWILAIFCWQDLKCNERPEYIYLGSQLWKKGFRYHRNELAQTDDVGVPFMVLANYLYQWSTYLAERKRTPITFQSVLADVYSSPFDLVRWHIQMTSSLRWLSFENLVGCRQRATFFAS